jgi:transposase
MTIKVKFIFNHCLSAWTIRAYTDDIRRFASPKKYSAYAELVPWARNSNETVRHGKITKRGPEELRTALVQVVMGLRRMKTKTFSWRPMKRYEAMKGSKGSGKAITATARKIAVIIWKMLAEESGFDTGEMTDRGMEKKSSDTGVLATAAEAAAK